MISSSRHVGYFAIFKFIHIFKFKRFTISLFCVKKTEFFWDQPKSTLLPAVKRVVPSVHCFLLRSTYKDTLMYFESNNLTNRRKLNQVKCYWLKTSILFLLYLQYSEACLPRETILKTYCAALFCYPSENQNSHDAKAINNRRYIYMHALEKNLPVLFWIRKYSVAR